MSTRHGNSAVKQPSYLDTPHSLLGQLNTLPWSGGHKAGTAHEGQ